MVLAARSSEGLTTADTIFARLLMVLVLVEFFADQQQWSRSSLTHNTLTLLIFRSYRLPAGEEILPENC